MATDTSITALVRAHISAFYSGDVERALSAGRSRTSRSTEKATPTRAEARGAILRR
jgi:hypothetical protein